jgi:hypothetical protein
MVGQKDDNYILWKQVLAFYDGVESNDVFFFVFFPNLDKYWVARSFIRQQAKWSSLRQLKPNVAKSIIWK